MKNYLKKIALGLIAACFACISTPAIAKTFAEKGQELGQKLDEAEKIAKEEAEKTKKKADEVAAILKKKAKEVKTEIDEIVKEDQEAAQQVKEAVEQASQPSS